MVKLLHVAPIFIYGLMAGYALLALLAGAYGLRRQSPPRWFWILSLVLLVVVLVHGVAGGLLYLWGDRPRRALHLLYGILVLGAALIQYGLRPGGLLRRASGTALTRDQVLTIALIAFTEAALIMRAWMTGAGVGLK